MKMKLHLLLFISMGCSGEWVKVDHFTPDLNYVNNNQQFSTIVSKIEKHSDNVVINNNVTSEHLSDDVIEEKVGESDKLFLDVTSQVKETLMKTNWLLGQQGDNSIQRKYIFLQNIKKNLLRGIWENCGKLWRRKSSDPRSTFGFPSIEGAIITIAFLTFAVFLIKIVQQFVLGLQGVAPSRVGFQIPNNQRARHRRENSQFINESAGRIFQYMDDFKIHNEL